MGIASGKPTTGDYANLGLSLFPYARNINNTVRQVSSEGVGSLRVSVYRVYGGGSSMYGRSYSLINPRYVPYYRNFAGLPSVNSGEYLLRGSLQFKDINVGRLFAAPLEGNTGGLPFELYQKYDQLQNPVNLIINKKF